MTDTFYKLREPVTLAVLVLAVVRLVIPLVELGLDVRGGARIGDSMLNLAPQLLGVGWVIAIVALVLACGMTAQPSPRARMLTAVGSVLVLVAAALGIVFLLVGSVLGDTTVLGTILDVVGALVDLGLKTVAGIFLWRLWRGMPPAAPVAIEAASTDVALTSGTVAERDAADPVDVEEESAELEPVWAADEAVGTQWTRAGDAATGARATTTGTTGAGRWAAASGGGTSANWAAIEGRRPAGEDPETPHA